jgi:hypothetical protein
LREELFHDRGRNLLAEHLHNAPAFLGGVK